MNYQKINNNLIVAGIIVKQYEYSSSARKKVFHIFKKWIIEKTHLNGYSFSIGSLNLKHEQEIQSEKNKILKEYVDEQIYKTDFLSSVKQDISKGLSFFHDYKQINATISQNINIVIETRYAGNDFDQKLEASADAEKAIYWASKFLGQKMDVAKYLLHPEWITNESEEAAFRFHGLFFKYLRIYQNLFSARKIKVNISGESRKTIFGNPEAIGVIIHTLIDNAYKYSPKNSYIDIFVQDIEEGIEFSVSSLGPKINDEEKTKIFYPFYRGMHAEKAQEEGAGYGLYISQVIAHALDTKITVQQNSLNKKNNTYETTFTIIFFV